MPKPAKTVAAASPPSFKRLKDGRIDGRSLRRTGRTENLSLRVEAGFADHLKVLAAHHRMTMGEVVERAVHQWAKEHALPATLPNPGLHSSSSVQRFPTSDFELEEWIARRSRPFQRLLGDEHTLAGARLTPDERQVFELVILGGCSLKQAANQLETPLPAVKRLLEKANNKISGHINADQGSAPTTSPDKARTLATRRNRATR
jgi:DNA-directed RNA polymerase specialized sigma24 family protein